MSLNVRFSAVLIFGWLCQAAVVPFISLGPIKPDLILIIVATLGFIDGPAIGAAGGFLGGLLQDLLTARSVGVEALIKTLVGYFSGQVERTILGDSALMPMFAIGAVSLVSQTLYIGLAFLVGEPIEFFPAMGGVVVPSALYTALIGSVAFPYLSRLLSAERQAKVFK